VCLVLGILSLVVESDRNEKNRKKIASQSAQGVVREESDPAAQKENEASKEGGNTSFGGNDKSGSTSLGEKENSPESKNKISRKVAPYASGAGAWAVNAGTKEQKKTYKVVSQIDPRRSISEILESADMSDPETRAAVVAFMSNREEVRYQAVLAKAELLGIPVRLDGPGHKVSILYDFRGEEPLYRTTLNANAAISTGANLIRQTAPYNLDGSGIKVGVWDGGSVRNTHQEFNTTRVVKRNSTVAVDDHATHVAGTIGASGFQASAKGMAPLVAIDSYDWNSDTAEMSATGAATANDSFTTKIPLSNHSYGFDAVTADMGRYETNCNELDALALSLPYYLVFWAAGNEQDTLTALGGYQSITFSGLSKNILTVGAADDAVTSGVRDISKGTLAYFSSMGPCDDGRIKPDLVANGVNVNSCISTSDTAYDATYSGTSMATPNAAGSATLLVQLYSREFSSQRMRSSMLKALLIHTADDVGRPGPDYQYGWGYLNVKAAADVILAHKASLAAPKMVDDSINNSSKTKSYNYFWDGTSPLKATLCWTDPAGTAQTAADSRTPNLKHNLDLKITAPDGTTTYQPYTMPFVGTWTQASMTLNATKGKNNVDNVERVDLPAPTQAGTYIVTVSLDGSLTTSTQAFSLIVTGASSAEANPPPTVSLTSPLNGAAVLPGQSVALTATAADMATGGQVGSVSKVEFLYGTTVISTDTTSPYSATWTPTSAGTYLLTARATDSAGAVTTSSQVEFSVLSGDGSPSISSFSPPSGAVGASVTITGGNFSGVTAVRFNGSASTSYTVNSVTQITAIVPAAATSGKISVTNSFGAGTSATDFVVVPIVLSEDFASITSGNSTSSFGSSTPWAGNSNFPTGTNDFQAGGAVRLGSGGAAGSITSKTLDLSSGPFDVSFDVKGWTTVEGGITVTVTGQTPQTVTYTSVMSGSFETKVLRFSTGTAATTITLATTAKRAFLDNIIVTKASSSVTAPVISSSLAQSGTVGSAFNYQITASGSPTSYGAAVLPPGLTLNTATGAITGTPTGAGTFSVNISATNSAGTGSAALVITVNPSASAPVISSSLAQSGTVGSSFNYQITASGSPTSYGAVVLPAGLTLNTSTGAITGTPTAAGTSNVSISATNGSGTGTATLVITVSPSGGGASGLIAGWDFQTTTSGGTAVVAAPSCPTTFEANFGTGTLYLNGSNGSSSWITTTTGNELSAFGGSTVNAGVGFSSTTSGVGSLAMIGGTGFSANGKKLVFKFSMSGRKDLVVSYATQRTGAGFTTHLWETSSDGTNWVIAETKTITATSFAATTLTAITSLDNASNAYLRLTVTGATNATGNNRLDNIQLNANAAATSPTVSVSGALAAVNTTYGTASSAPTSFAVSGSNLTEAISVNAPAGYEISQTEGGASGYAATQTVGAAGTVAAKTMYLRLMATTPVGTYSGNVTCNSAGSAGAIVATAASSVAKKQLTITGMVGVDKVYNGTTSAELSGTLSYVGLVNGESLGVTGVANATFDNKNVGVGKTVTISGFTDPNGNYSVTAPTVTATISPKEVVIVDLSGANKPYDGILSATLTGTANLLGVELADQASVVLGGTPLVSFVSENAGVGIGLVVSGYALIGAEALNYQVVQPAGLSADITPRPATIRANDQFKTIGTIFTLGAGQSGFTSTGLVAGEEISTVTLVASGGLNAQDPAGSYSIIPSDPLGGGLNRFRPENYAFTFTNGTLTVRAAESTFAGWAGEGVSMTPELLMKYAIGGAASPSDTGELPVAGKDESYLTLTAVVRKDSTLTIVGQAVANLEDYGTPASVTSLRGTSEGVSQDGVPTDCERKIFKSNLQGTKSFLRLSVQKP
jgi:hypothetical protein